MPTKPVKKRSLALGVVGGCFVLLGIAGTAVWLGLRFLGGTLDAEAHLAAARLAFVGQPAPAARSTTLDGESWQLADQRGKVVLLDFWATWCGPCIVDLPHLSALYQRYHERDDFLFVGVSLDHRRQALVSGLEQHAIEWLQLYEEGRGWSNSVARSFDVRSIPHLVVIDQAGIIRAVEPSDAELSRLLDELLATPVS